MPEHLEVGHRVVGEAEDLRLQRGEVDQFSAVALQGAARNACVIAAGVRAGHPLPHLSTHVRGRPVLGAAPDTDGPTGPRLQGELGGRPVMPRTVQTERCDRGDDQVRDVAGAAAAVRSTGQLRIPRTEKTLGSYERCSAQADFG